MSRQHRGRGRSTSRRSSSSAQRNYPRAARINEVLRQVLASELERLEDTDERLGMLTVTAVQVEPDLRAATVLFSSLSEDAAQALAERRAHLQSVVARQVRLKWTPQLSFEADPVISGAAKVEEILAKLRTEREAEATGAEDQDSGGEFSESGPSAGDPPEER